MKKKILFPAIVVIVLLVCIIYIQNSKTKNTSTQEQTSITSSSYFNEDTLNSTQNASTTELFSSENFSTAELTSSEVLISTTAEIESTQAEEKKWVVCIDPGHQSEPNLEREQRAPGSDKTNVKVASGAWSSVFKAEEYDITLGIALKLRDLLIEEGYEVHMTREINEVNISNRERVELANSINADAAILIHVDGYDDTSVNGFSLLVPTKDYVSEEIYNESQNLAESLKGIYKEYTGAKLRGLYERNDLVALNWAKIPIVLVETGFLSNLDEGAKLLDDEYQMSIAKALRDGLKTYFETLETENSSIK